VAVCWVAGSLGAVFTALGGGGWYAGAPDDMPDMFMCFLFLFMRWSFFPTAMACIGCYQPCFSPKETLI